ncbi:MULTISPECIES: FAD/NAD(P)-binding protein [unclassified Mesorhizobium]|uniref:FAD/NAD(P)-binding protein n=1 Tax=unclassified Mesorhizobium TaxID=325217 RepID=UPI003014C74B
MNVLVRSGRPHVVIIGGGFSGAAVVLHLAHAHGPDDLEITVIEPRSFLGGGVAYSSEEPAHRVNVPATRMSMFSDDPDHFDRWLSANGELDRDREALWTNGDAYPRRRVFGRYVEAQLHAYLASGRVRHIRALATRIEKTAASWTVTTERGERLTATFVVLAVTHPAPAVPEALSGIAQERGFVANPYASDALAEIDTTAKVLIVGSGLTSADMVAELDRRGHRGGILAISRHGLRSRGHPAKRCEPFGDFAADPARTALELLRRVRATVRAASGSGGSWHSVLDRLRSDGLVIWSALSPEERYRLVRRLRVFWDVHRFRIAPQVEAVLERRLSEGFFANIAASLVAARRQGDLLAVSFRRRGQREIETLRFDAVINTTGPAHRTILEQNPALRGLADHGILRLDRYGLGLETNGASRAISSDGVPVATLLVAGPLARGAFGELMGLPEVARHAQAVAAEVGTMLGRNAAGINGLGKADQG